MPHSLNIFRGLTGEDPNRHLKEFHVVCSSMKQSGTTKKKVEFRALYAKSTSPKCFKAGISKNLLLIVGVLSIDLPNGVFMTFNCRFYSKMVWQVESLNLYLEVYDPGTGLLFSSKFCYMEKNSKCWLIEM